MASTPHAQNGNRTKLKSVILVSAAVVGISLAYKVLAHILQNRQTTHKRRPHVGYDNKHQDNRNKATNQRSRKSGKPTRNAISYVIYHPDDDRKEGNLRFLTVLRPASCSDLPNVSAQSLINCTISQKNNKHVI